MISELFKISIWMEITFEYFKNSLKRELPPPTLSPALKSLWYDAKGNWDQAHKIADDLGGNDGNWVHAYLHRKEGDTWNADYWYRRAGKTSPSVSLKEEWEIICRAILDK